MPESDPLTPPPPASPAAAQGGSASPSQPATPPPNITQPTAAQKAYWRANIAFVAVLLVIWFTVSAVCGIFLVDWLNGFSLGGYPLGFWFSQQGSVIVFIFLILIYALGMGVLDRKYGLETPDPALQADAATTDSGDSPDGGAA